MLRSVYLSQKLTRPLPKDGGTLRTVAEARTYMIGLPKQRALQTRWQRVAGLILEEAMLVLARSAFGGYHPATGQPFAMG
jgi:hypothetical protein